MIEPEDYAKYFPANIVAQIDVVRKDSAMKFDEKAEKIDKLISQVPAEIRDNIPPPSGFLELPTEIQNKYKAIHRNSSLTFKEKKQQTEILFKEMPEKYRHFVLPAHRPCRTVKCLCRRYSCVCWCSRRA
uniref:Uncharacterized protein n=1 Tax=Panagrolaimus davidi TaxID=227884 RepID=A0A914QBN2_9BILA